MRNEGADGLDAAPGQRLGPASAGVREEPAEALFAEEVMPAFKA